MVSASLSASSQPAGRAGLARRAAQSPRLGGHGRVGYFALEVRSALNRESSGRMPFAWTLNPYRGCEFGCKYCYARYTHEFLELWDGRDFERKIFAKPHVPELLRAELRAAKDRGWRIALGTATDPYQPAERDYQITRRLLEVVAEFQGLDFSLTTKSVLILRDLDLLRLISGKHCFRVHLTVITTDERLACRLEPKAPPSAKRLEAVAMLASAGIRVSVMAMPLLPALNDSPDALEELARAAAQAGAQALYGHPLSLTPSTLRQFMPWLEREYPQLVPRYRRLYTRSAYLNGEYKERMAKLLADLRARYRLEGDRDDPPPTAWHPQLPLPFENVAAALGPAPLAALYERRSALAPCREGM